MEQGKLLLAIPFIMAFFSDTGAYFIGVLFGKHKMAPLISPKKSWEGAIGGSASALILGVMFVLLYHVFCFKSIKFCIKFDKL